MIRYAFDKSILATMRRKDWRERVDQSRQLGSTENDNLDKASGVGEK